MHNAECKMQNERTFRFKNIMHYAFSILHLQLFEVS